MCMKCGCGKKAGQKGYGKGNPKKTAEHIKPKPSYKKEKVPIKKPKQPALSGFLGGIIPKKPNKPTPSKKKPLPNATKWDSSKKKPLPRPSLNSKPQWKLLSKTNRSAKKSMPKRRAM